MPGRWRHAARPGAPIPRTGAHTMPPNESYRDLIEGRISSKDYVAELRRRARREAQLLPYDKLRRGAMMDVEVRNWPVLVGGPAAGQPVEGRTDESMPLMLHVGSTDDKGVTEDSTYSLYALNVMPGELVMHFMVHHRTEYGTGTNVAISERERHGLAIRELVDTAMAAALTSA